MDYANIILEMLDRIKKLEKEVEQLKRGGENEEEKDRSYYLTKMSISNPENFCTQTNKRDTTRYMFEGNVYLKNRLVLEVVKKYVKDSTQISRDELKQVFSKSLQGSFGVVENVEICSQNFWNFSLITSSKPWFCNSVIKPTR